MSNDDIIVQGPLFIADLIHCNAGLRLSNSYQQCVCIVIYSCVGAWVPALQVDQISNDDVTPFMITSAICQVMTSSAATLFKMGKVIVVF